jgi:hypothetical protein
VPEFALSFDCPHCRKQWVIDARVRRDDDCPRCGVVSKPTRVRVIEDWARHITPKNPRNGNIGV